MIVYLATNTVNGKQYVGQTIQSLPKRKSQHLYFSRVKTVTMALQHAIKKYSEDAFTWEIITECHSRDILNQAEKEYIELYNTIAPNGYNLRKGGNSYGFSEESIQKMREAGIKNGERLKGIPLSLETRRKMSKVRKGRKFSEETKNKMSNARKGMKLSKETRKKMSEAKKGNTYRRNAKLLEEQKGVIYE